LPFALYGLYLLLERLRPETPAHKHPWTGLFIAGLSLFALSFLVWGLTEGDTEKGVYVAPHVVDGTIVPGHIEKPR
jgi:hypothetical protein